MERLCLRGLLYVITVLGFSGGVMAGTTGMGSSGVQFAVGFAGLIALAASATNPLYVVGRSAEENAEPITKPFVPKRDVVDAERAERFPPRPGSRSLRA